jgi:hypothetical protein
MTGLDAALDAVERFGWPLFPVRSDGTKRPLITDWRNGASTDPAVIGTWWRRHRSALIGVPTGRRVGFVVLDIDVKHLDAYGFDTLAELGCAVLPDTPMAHTRSGGLHLYFAYSGYPEIGNSIGKHGLGPGLDVRGEGGFVVIPCPGSGYSWDPHCNLDTAALFPAPAWLGYRQRQRDSAQAGARRLSSGAEILAGCCDHIREAVAGEKHSTIRREAFIAGTLVRDRRVSARHARHELEAALACLRSNDRRARIADADGAFAEGLAAPRRRA